jgi:hypothetical protein
MNTAQGPINAVAAARTFLTVMQNLTVDVVGLLLIAVFLNPLLMNETRVMECIEPKFYVKIVAGI